MSLPTNPPAELTTRQVLSHYFAPYKRRLSIIPVCSFVGGMADAIALVVLAQAALKLASTDADGPSLATFGIDLELSLGQSLLVILAFTILRLLAQASASWAAAGVVAAVSVSARRNSLAVFLESSYGSQSQMKQGELQQLLSEPVTKVSDLSIAFTKIITTALNLAALLLSAVLVDWRAATVLAVVGVLLFAMLRPVVRLGRRFSVREASATRDYSTAVSEIEAMALEIQVFDVTAAIRARSNDKLEELRVPLFRRHIVQPMTPMVFQAAVVIVTVASLSVLMRMDNADLAALGAILLLVFKAMGHGQTFQATWQRMQFTFPYAEQLQAAITLHRAAPRPAGTVGLNRIERVELCEIGHRFADHHVALDGLSFTIHDGEAIGVVGPSGSGKTTLLQLLLRLREPTSGAIRVNGTELSMISIDDWYRRVAFVPQECHLVEGTIAENIRFYRPGFSDEDVAEAGRLAGIHDEIVRRPGGYNTSLGPRGAGLSGGQRQRVAIARALVGKPDFLVLDEPTSALDAASEKAIAATLEALKGKVTTVIVTHRLETVSHCDRILELEAPAQPTDPALTSEALNAL